MGSDEALKLPVIDFTNVDFEGNSSKWELVKSQVHKAIVEFGCFEALSDEVPLDLKEATFLGIKELFDLPLQTKLRNLNHDKPYLGYIGQHSIFPLYEALGIQHPTVHEDVETFTNMMWAEGNPHFSKPVHSFTNHLRVLDLTIKKMVLESLGVEKYLEEHINSTDYFLRVLKYEAPRSRSSEPEVGLMSHLDRNIMTILCQHQVDGLHVQTKDGDWIKFMPSPKSFFVIVGESLHAWSNGRLHTPYHRVLMSGDKTRYSLGLFSATKEGHITKAPEELVDEEHPLLYKPYEYHEFMKFYLSEQGLKAQSALKAYCGV